MELYSSRPARCQSNPVLFSSFAHHNTVVGPVELGEITCAALDDAVDAPSVSLTIHDERIIAKQSSYSLTDGSAFDDGIGRHV